MFGSSGNNHKAEEASVGESKDNVPSSTAPVDSISIPAHKDETSTEKSAAAAPAEGKSSPDESSPNTEKKRRSSGVSKAKDMFASARQSLHLHNSLSPTSDKAPSTQFQKLSKQDPALGVPQGPQNNSAGESLPTAHSTFRVGVTEDKNKKCRRTMEDTHAYLYNFLSTPLPAVNDDAGSSTAEASSSSVKQVEETDNGYFAIFDGHAGTFAADWCGKKLHLLLEDIIRKNPNTPVPELLDQTFTQVDQQLEKLPLKNSGCTAVIAVLRWEDRVPNPASATGSSYINQAALKAASEDPKSQGNSKSAPDSLKIQATEAKLREQASRQRVLYTANVGDARIVLCRNGRALRLSYDHKGSDESEGRRVANAGGLILNNRVNGVLAVTRALGDAYMKDLVTGHPYTTETVIQPDQDEFLILACDGLWDVCSDQEAVDLVRNVQDPQAASKTLVDHALARFSTDNLSCMIVRFDNKALKARKQESSIGVEGDHDTGKGISEADAIVSEAKKNQSDTLNLEGSHAAASSGPESIPEGVEDAVDTSGVPKLDPEAPKAAMKHS